MQEDERDNSFIMTVFAVIKPSLKISRGATDQNTHGSDRITVLSHGSDHFSDQQKRKKVVGLGLNYFKNALGFYLSLSVIITIIM